MKHLHNGTWNTLTLLWLILSFPIVVFAQEPSGSFGQSNSFGFNTNSIGFGECTLAVPSGIPVQGASNQKIILGSIIPNPFNPLVSISFSIPDQGLIEIGIYDIGGKCIRQLANEYFPSGTHSTQWNGRDQDGAMMPAGIYFVRLKGQAGTHSKKITLLK